MSRDSEMPEQPNTTTDPAGGVISPSKNKKVATYILFTVGAIAGLLIVATIIVFVVSSSRINQTFQVEPVPLAVAPSDALVKRGREIATFRGCRDCHGDDLSGRLVGDGMPVMVLAGPNITPGGRTKDYSDVDWARAIRHGVRPDGTSALFMPSYEYTELSHGDLAAIISYARSVGAVSKEGPRFELGPLGRVLYLAGELPLVAAELVDHDAEPAVPTRGPTAEYGAYLASACVGCHGHGLSGGPIPGVPPDWPEAPNLTFHESGLKDWSFDDFRAAFRTGKRPDGTELRREFMPYNLVSESSTDDDIRALWEHIKTVPPKPVGGR